MYLANVLLYIILVASFNTGCSKSKNDNDKPKTNRQILTTPTWEVLETYQNLSGTRTHYIKGGENTTGVNIERMRFKFNDDGTGTTTDISGSTFDITWNFTTPDQTDLKIIVNGNVEYNWIFTDIQQERIISTSLVATNGLVIAKWIPAP